MKTRLALAALLILSAPGVVAGDDEWQATGGLRPDSGRGLHTTTLAVDPGIGLIYVGTDTGTVYRRASAGIAPVPIALDDVADTPANTPVTIDVLANDSDPASMLDAGSVTVTQAPEHGFAMIESDGRVLYAPDIGHIGSDTFRYTVANLAGQVSASALVAVTALPQQLLYQPTHHDFGARPVGDASPHAQFMVINDHGRAVRLSALDLSGNDLRFEVTQDDCSNTYLDADQTCMLAIRYRADIDGTHVANVRFTAALGSITLNGQTQSALDDRIFGDGFELDAP